MAKKASTATKTAPKGAVAKSTPVAATSTPVRNTPIPKVTTPVKREVTHEMISRRAYEIFASGTGGSEQDNWSRAERELKGL